MCIRVIRDLGRFRSQNCQVGYLQFGHCWPIEYKRIRTDEPQGRGYSRSNRQYKDGFCYWRKGLVPIYKLIASRWGLRWHGGTSENGVETFHRIIYASGSCSPSLSFMYSDGLRALIFAKLIGLPELRPTVLGDDGLSVCEPGIVEL